MSALNRNGSWRVAAVDALWSLRPVLWAAIGVAVWLTLIAPSHAQPFPFPPPGSGCAPNTSCVPGGGPGGGNPGQCSPNPNGDPGCNGAGNPVDVITGNKYQQEVDLAPLPGELGLRFSRQYNSNSTHRGLTGVGWRSNFEVVLVDLGSVLQIIDADGRRITFERNSQQSSVCVGARPEDGRVIIDDGGNEAAGRVASDSSPKTRALVYRWQRLDGAEYVFSGGSGEGHPLQSIRAASGATLTLNYLGGALDSVRDAQGRVLRFIYARPLAAGSTRHRMLALSAIDTPVGRISYRHDEYGRLQSVMQPNGLLRRYHYEPERQGSSSNTWALTGISVETVQDGKTSSERLATYVYDARGRAVRTQNAGGDDLTLAYGPKAATTITTATGARTVYRHALVAGQWKTVEAIGPSCGTCPLSNVRYRYRTEGAQAGQLEATLRLDAQGKPLQQERVTVDAWGRPTRVERIDYVNGKAPQQPKPEWVLRAEYRPLPQNLQSLELSAAQYAALWRPQLVARPSVVAGREHSVAFTYNAHLQPVTKTEAGASPLDAEGNLVPTALTRTTSYRYAQIAGVSRLTAIDGPLPGNADTTTFHYDELGRLRLVQHPVPDLQERFAYDDAGRVVWQMPLDAVPVRTRYPDAAQTLATLPLLPAAIERAGRAAQYRFNARGWLTAWIDGPRAVHLAYNNQGRVIEASDAQGNRVTWNRDEAKRLEAALWFDAGQANVPNPTSARSNFRWFDQADRTTKTLAADGRTDEYNYDAEGRLTQHVDGDGVARLYRARSEGADSAMVARIDVAPDQQMRLFMWRGAGLGDNKRTDAIATDAAIQRRLRDDFGRIVRVDLPEHGTRVTQYDAADQIQRTVFADGAQVQYAYDAAGRMVEKSVLSPDGERESNITLRYYGAYLIEVIDPAQTTAYRYDSAGQRVETRITLKAPDTAAATYTIGTVFDARGQPVEHRLADGRSITVERAAASGLPTALTLQAAGLQPAQPIIGAITAQPFNGITGFTHGNGIATAREYDAAGRLTALSTGSVLNLRYEYQAGPRIRAIRDGGQPPSSVSELRYDGFGALQPDADQGSLVRTALDRASIAGPRNPQAQADGAAVARDIRGRLLADEQYSYRYDALDRLIAVHRLADDRLIARYAYNAFGERVSKTTFDEQGAARQRLFLYQRSQVVAEIAVKDDGTTRIERQYLYLNGSPVALLDSQNESAPRLLAVHTDHRGAPLAMTDAQQRIVWRATYRDAWGEVGAVDAAALDAPGWQQALHKLTAGRYGAAAYAPATLNLRLPGQYADQETGLHYNLQRYYDPRRAAGGRTSGVQRVSFNGKAVHGQGRYLTPDPLGYPDGPDPYLYASGDPINKIDPLGLYQSDVHYYMTFFLAVAAGMRAEDARTMALAAQFIDDNPATRPVDLIPGTNLPDPTSIYRNQQRLLRYHFAFSDPTSGTVPVQYRIEDLSNPDAKSAQLRALYSYAAPTPSQGACNYPNSQSLQFMGEYLHAFEDTFSHRDRNNIPYDAVNGAGLGVGHGAVGSAPDYTYNAGSWQSREGRTYAMESETYSQISRYMVNMNFFVSGRNSGRVVGFDQLEAVLQRFNATPATEPRESTGFRAKIEILNEALNTLGFSGIDMRVGGPDGYDQVVARTNRQRNFAGLDPRNFPNAILEPR